MKFGKTVDGIKSANQIKLSLVIRWDLKLHTFKSSDHYKSRNLVFFHKIKKS